MNKWQPIETAPKTGKWILAWWENLTDVPFVVFFHTPTKEWREPFTGDAFKGFGKPSHWMPLPEPPK